MFGLYVNICVCDVLPVDEKGATRYQEVSAQACFHLLV